MERNPEDVKRAILEQYEVRGGVDTRDWLAQYPDLALDLLDFIIWLDGSPAAEEGTDSAAEKGADRQISQVAESMKRVRREKATRFQGGRANPRFKRAAVLAWTVERMQRRRERVTRLCTQKAVYFLERGLDLDLFTQHRRMKLGPYDSQAKYKDAEPIAQQQGWIVARGTSLAPGPKIDAVHRYASRYLVAEDVAAGLIDLLAGLSDDELETWATVDVGAVALRSQGRTVDAAAIKGHLSTDPTWAPKLRKANFSDDRIARALQDLGYLGYVEQG
jgi:hypothetical protein